MSLGLYVEGRSDKDTIPILIRKLGYRSRVINRIVPRSEMLNTAKMLVHLRVLFQQHSDIDLVVICIDSEGVEPSTTRGLTRPVERQLNRDTQAPVRFAVVDHALEGWLACDEEAIQAVMGPRARVNVRGNPENHPRPAEILEQLFRQNGRKFRKTRHDPLIAEYVNLDRVVAQSPTFGRFAEILGHPVTG